MIVVRTGQFKKDYKRLMRQGKELEKLKSVIRDLCEGKPLSPRHRNHRLSGRMRDYNECHIEPDWLLIYRIDPDAEQLILARTGSHSDLFR